MNVGEIINGDGTNNVGVSSISQGATGSNVDANSTDNSASVLIAQSTSQG